MTNNWKTELVVFVKKNLIFLLVFFSIIFLEIYVYNHQFFVTTFQNLRNYQFNVSDGSLYGFEQVNQQLISEHNDPHITFQHIDDRIRYVNIQCTNPNPNALNQVFFRRELEDWSEENSLTFPLSHPETTVSLPRTIKITSLRLDLTNNEGDTLSCLGFTLNPKTPFNMSFVRLALLLVSILGLLFGSRMIPDDFSNAIWATIIDEGVWVFILLIVLIDMAYPVTITFDSAHYLWLTDLIRTGDWAAWDPIRYLGFPLHIFLSLTLLGFHQNTLLYPMIFAHVVLFFFSCQIVFDVFKLKKGRNRFLTSLFIFLFITMDATVVGYFHTLLTEFLAATIAVISCSIAIKLYESPVFSKRFYGLSSFFVLTVPIAWHIKQPYIGAAFFPLLIVTLLIFLRQVSWKTLVYVVGIHLTVVILVIVSTMAWYNFLRERGNPLPQERQLTTMLEEKLLFQTEISKEGRKTFLKEKVDEFLAISNYYVFDFRTYSVIKNPQIGRGNENTVIAHRMFNNPGQSNLYFSSPAYISYTADFQTTYKPPVWLNVLFQSRTKFSHLLFTITNLSLLIFVIIVLILWIKEKSTLITSLLLLSSASLMNLTSHLFLIIPNDRYQFWGYVLNLLILTINLVFLVNYSQKNVDRDGAN